jgi:hypothetical protein
MRVIATHILLVCIVLLVASGLAAIASAQSETIRVVNYNIEDDIDTYTGSNGVPRPGLVQPADNSGNYTGTVSQGGVLEGIGEEPVGANNDVQPLDILSLEETTSNSTTVAPIVSALNTYYNSPGMYAQSPVQSTESGNNPANGNGPNAIVYNTKTLQLVASLGVGTPGGSSNGEYRQVMRYEFAPAGVTAKTFNEFYLYVVHMKSSYGDSTPADFYQDENYRQQEATIIRTNAASLPAGSSILYMGDFNTSNTNGFTNPNPPNQTASVYQTMLASGAGQAVDPLNPTNQNESWDKNPTYAAIMTEDDYDLKYREDLQLMTSNVYNGTGPLQYVSGTSHAFANNGSAGYGNSVNSGSNTALSNVVADGGTFISKSSLLNDLTYASDHLPVVADYTVPVVLPGDFNQDGHVDAADIPALELALTDLSAYELNYGVTYTELMKLCEIPGDSADSLNNSDLQALLSLLQSGGGSTSVPEPASFILLAFGELFVLCSRRCRI